MTDEPPAPHPAAAGSDRRRSLLLLAGLYVSMAVPQGFFFVALPVLLRDAGHSLRTVGLFAAIAIPWVLKFLWAPMVDRWGSARRGHFLSWILPLQVGSIACVAMMASLDPGVDLRPLALAALGFMLLAATQDIATDGLAVRILDIDGRGLGNGVQVGGYYLGQVLGGGGMLVAFFHLGWGSALLSMALVLALPLAPAARFREPPAPPKGEEPGQGRRMDFRAFGRFFRRVGGTWVLVLLIFRAGEGMATYVFNQVLVDLGLGIDEIGIFSGVLYAVGALAGAMLGGLAVARLGRRRALASFAALQALALGAYLLPALGFVALPVVAGAVLAVALAGGMATAALYTSMMDHSDSATPATDFTLQQSLCAFGPLLGAIASGFLADRLGFTGHFAFCGLVSALAAVLVLRARLPVESAPTIRLH